MTAIFYMTITYGQPNQSLSKNYTMTGVNYTLENKENVLTTVNNNVKSLFNNATSVIMNSENIIAQSPSTNNENYNIYVDVLLNIYNQYIIINDIKLENENSIKNAYLNYTGNTVYNYPIIENISLLIKIKGEENNV